VSDESVVAARLVAVLDTHQEAILSNWVSGVAVGGHGRISQAEVERDVGSVFDAVRTGLTSGSLTGTGEAYATARGVVAELSRDRARQGFTPTETCVTVFRFKDSVFRVLTDTDGGLADFPPFSRLIDDLGLFSFETYAAAREQIIVDQSDQLLELSTPVVKLWDGIVAVPLIGTLDSARTQIVMEKLLQMLVDTGSEHAIIDITGVSAVDTQVAQHLLKTVMAARLMGAECIISGIRPQIAQTIVALGIEFGDIRTKATLADALVTALRSSGVVVGGSAAGAVRARQER